MAKKEDFAHKGRKFTLEAFPIGYTGKSGCAIYPEGQTRGMAMFEPDAVFVHGKLVHYDSDDEAIQAGKDYIRGDFLYEQ